MDKPLLEEHQSNLTRLRDYISNGRFVPGERLPAERALCEALDLTRTNLRRALSTLEHEGIIWRHVGRGTFLSEPSNEAPSDWVKDVSRELTPVKMMRARMSIEPAIAREAAINASGKALTQIMHALEGCENALDWASYEAYDDDFHHAIAAATDNPLLIGIYDQMNAVQRKVAWSNVVRETDRPPRSHSSFSEHREICEAITARDHKRAHQAMRTHIGSVSARLFGEI